MQGVVLLCAGLTETWESPTIYNTRSHIGVEGWAGVMSSIATTVDIIRTCVGIKKKSVSGLRLKG